MSTAAPEPASDHPTAGGDPGEAFRRPGDEVAQALGVDPADGLSVAEVEHRRARSGANELEEAPRDPAWKRFAAQFKDLLILILVVAAAISFVVSGELKTPIVVLVVVLLNATIGFVQENRAEASLEALQDMLVTETRVRRDGELRTVPAGELVPGDVVQVEAGDRVPADGRLLTAVQLEIEESALTGESLPAEKSTAPIDADGEVALGDRVNMAFMNATVTRGRGELVVTTTGMGTEVGRIAGLLRSTESAKTPLQQQLDGLARNLALLAGGIVAVVFIIGLFRGQSVSDLFLTAVALAVAAIPEGLPAVTAVTLALGVSNMARHNAIVKRLASVETLGCTSVICTDKTGTLTLNQMTAREMILGGVPYAVTGEGYDPSGSIVQGGGAGDVDLDRALVPMALCSDAVVRDEDGTPTLVGDPTEGALITLAAKGGIDAGRMRQTHPRVGEVPFSSENKFMATIHDMGEDAPGGGSDPGSPTGYRIFVKGAPDALLGRSSRALDASGEVVRIEAARSAVEDHNARLADEGMRVLAVADRALSDHEWSRVGADDHDPIELVDDLVLVALVGIVDPPREAAHQAVAEARGAGIGVKMITGDHAATAAAIGAELELAGVGGEVDAITGTELDRLDDDELDARIGDIEVFARVAPEHKLRLVRALGRQGQVVAMTGDGVNDAPALKQADMGVAMGITGTEVTKEAATMVLTDDNFATIVAAVRRGRTIYDNIVKFVRFQLSTTLGFAVVFLAAAVADIASGQPFTAIAILWVNVIMDGPPAMALGLDPGDERIMARRPRPRSEPILTRQRWGAIAFSATIMAAGTLAVLALGPDEPVAGEASVAGTMAFATFVLFQAFNLLNARSDDGSVFRRQSLSNWQLWAALGLVVVLQVAVTHVPALQSLFDTTGISALQWLVCVAVASSVLWAEEVRKVATRRGGDPTPAPCQPCGTEA